MSQGSKGMQLEEDLTVPTLGTQVTFLLVRLIPQRTVSRGNSCIGLVVSICGELAPLLCASGEAEHHDGQSIWWTKVTCFMSAKKEDEQEEVGIKRERRGLGSVLSRKRACHISTCTT